MHKKLLLEIFAILSIVFLLYKVDYSNEKTSSFYYKKEDIYYEYLAAKEIQNGNNPYIGIDESNMIDNEKYTTMFPLYYYFLAVIRFATGSELNSFLDFYRLTLFISQFTGGLFIYLIFRRIDKRLLGLFGALVYMFNVWSLESFTFLKQDMIAICLLLGSFYFFNSKRWFSYVLFGLSLGIKHIGIFAFPIFLTPLLFREESIKKSISHLLLLFLTVFVPMIPFLIESPSSFLNSMLFSVTRGTGNTEFNFGYEELLVRYSKNDKGSFFEQILPRFPLLVASALGVVLLFMKSIPRSSYLFVSILVFAIFNPVIFPQYITWIPPFALVALVDLFEKKPH